MPNGARWFAAGNEATGFIAVGNVATGVIAFGNVARGFLAVGNVAVGVVAFGNVAFGVLFGGGASIGIGLGAVAGALALPVLEGAGGALTSTDLSPVLGFVPILAWGLLSRALRGERPPRPEFPPLGRLEDLLGARVSEVWLRLRLQAVSGRTIEARHNGQPLALEAASESVALQAVALTALGPGPALVRLAQVEHLHASDGYRDAPRAERILSCQEVRPPPPLRVPWSSAPHIQWCLAWAWRAGAVLGFALWAARLL